MATMSAERLIAQMKPRPALWDLRNYNYNNRTLCNREWSEMATALGFEIETVKAKWKSLRDTYRRELRKAKLGQKSRWIHYPRMSFLRDALEARDRRRVAADTTTLIDDHQKKSPPARCEDALYFLENPYLMRRQMQTINKRNHCWLNPILKRRKTMGEFHHLHATESSIIKTSNLRETITSAERLSATLRFGDEEPYSGENQPPIILQRNVDAGDEGTQDMEEEESFPVIKEEPEIELTMDDISVRGYGEQSTSWMDEDNLADNPKKMFLLSLLPDLEQMSEQQMRLFKRSVLQLTCQILDSNDDPKNGNVPGTARNN